MGESSRSTSLEPTRAMAGWGWVALLGVMVLAVFGRTVWYPFLDWDDADLVVGNPLLGLSGRNLSQIWLGSVFGLYTPMAYTVWALVAGVFGKSAWAFHAVNVGLHFGTVVLVYRLVLLRYGWKLGAFLGAAIFAVHPVQVEAVAWVSGMNNLLAGLFSVGALYALCLAKERKSGQLFWGATGLLLLALLSKPTAIVVPLAGVLLVGWDRRLVLWGVMCGVFVWIGAQAQPGTEAPFVRAAERPLVALDAIGFYLMRITTLSGGHVDYGRIPDVVVAGRLGWVYSGLGVLTLIGLVVSFRFFRSGFTAGAIGLVCLLPILGLKPFDFQIISTVADRYLYLGMLGVAIFAGGLPRRSVWIMAPVVLVCCGLSVIGISKWGSTQALALSVIRDNPRSHAGYRMLAFLAAKNQESDKAANFYHQSLQARPTAVAYLGLGNLAINSAPPDPVRAAEQFTSAINLSKSPVVLSRALTNRGVAYEMMGNPGAGRQDYLDAMLADPTYAPPVANLARLTVPIDRGQAKALYLRALALDPTLGPALRGLAGLSDVNIPATHP